MFFLNATKSCLTLVAGEMLVAGSVNVHEVKFEFSDDWSDLVKTVTFRTVSDSRSVILNDEGECIIPWEVLKDSSPYLYVGLIGTRDAEVVLPTIWADLGEVRNGTTPGADVTAPTPTVYEQVLSELGSRANNMNVKDEKLQLRSGETVLSEVELPKQEEPCTTDHAALLNRDAADQHPIEAITGLADALKDKLTKDDVDLVLAQAKESGEFDGKDGYTPVKGKDYYTEADKAELVEEVLEQIPEQPSGGISVDKAEIGQTIVVKAVDENGKPTEWKTTDFPKGVTSWNDLADKPFGDETPEPIVFDGNIEGRVTFSNPQEAGAKEQYGEELVWCFVKVSDKLYTREELNLVIISQKQFLNGELANDVRDGLEFTEISGNLFGYQSAALYFYNTDPMVVSGLTFQAPEPGLYFTYQYVPNFNGKVMEMYTTKLEFLPNVKTLDEKYMPTLTSPNGTKYKLTVDDSGAVSAVEVTG